MAETINNDVTTTVTLDTPDTQNPLVVTATGNIDVANGVGVLGTAGFAWTIDNSGTIIGDAGGGFDGVKLTAGGTVTNGAGGATTALISGFDGVYIDALNSAALVSNFATIQGGSNGAGVLIDFGGTVANAAGALITSGYFGVDIENVPGTVSNLGTIVGAAADGAVRLDGGVVQNGSSAATGAVINGGTGVGVYNAGGALTLTNYGTVTVSGTLAAIENNSGSPATIDNFGMVTSGGTAVLLVGVGGGTVSNAAGALISGADGIAVLAGSGSVVNAGTVSGTAAAGIGVYLSDGGYVGNQAKALIGGGLAGVSVVGAPGSVVNFGSIAGSTGYGVVLAAGGSVRNEGGTVPASITGAGGVRIDGTAATVTNFGSIAATTDNGVDLAVSGAGDQALVVNSGTILGTAADGVLLSLAGGAAGTVSNGGSIAGGTGGVSITGGVGTIVNLGSITTTGNLAVYLGAGGTVTNGQSGSSAGLIAGARSGVGIIGTIATVVNFGTIEGPSNDGTHGDGIGINLASGTGTVTNAGLVEGYQHGVFFMSGNGSVVNSGTIAGTGSHGIGVSFATLSQADTMTNGGTIIGSSGTAVAFGVAANRLILDPGAVFVGAVVGGSGASTNTLELAAGAGTGTLTGFAASFVNFGTVTVDAGASWLLGVGNTVAAGVTLTSAGRLFNAGSIATEVTLTANGYLDNEVGGQISNTTTAVSGGSIANSGQIAGIVSLTDDGSLVNAGGGTIAGGGANPGVSAVAGGHIVNGAVGATNALISGYNGIIVGGGAGTVTNYGTVAGSGIAAAGVALDAGGSVVNHGSILATGAQSYGVLLDGGGLTNGAAGTTGALIESAGKVAILLLGGGAVTNFGDIEATGAAGIGVMLHDADATLVNAGTIDGAGGTAVAFAGGDLLVIDPGAVFVGTVGGGAGGNFLELAAGSGVGTLSGLGSKYVGFGAVRVDAGASWTLAGSDTIAGGVAVEENGVLTVAGTLRNSGYIGVNGYLIDSGSLFNAGTVNGGVSLTAGGYFDNQSGALVERIEFAVFGSGGPVGIVNAGSIASSDSEGIYLTAGGTVRNLAGGEIFAGADAIVALNAAATIVNYGTIDGFEGVYLDAGGSITNHAGGVIEGQYGIDMEGNGTLTNAGTIIGYGGDAVALGGSDLLIVDAGAVFVGSVNGGGSSNLELAAGVGTGTLSGLGTQFFGFEQIKIDAGGRWRLSGDGSAMTFVDDGTILVEHGDELIFGAVGEDAGAQGIIDLGSHGVAQFDAAVAAGLKLVFTDDSGTLRLDDAKHFAATISGFEAGDVIDLVGEKANKVVFKNGELKILESGKTVAKLALSGSYKTSEFMLKSDGNGGTEILLKAGGGAVAGAGVGGAADFAVPSGLLPDFWTIGG